jgi:hypothetical protein
MFYQEYLVKKYKNLNIKPDEYCGYVKRERERERKGGFILPDSI